MFPSDAAQVHTMIEFLAVKVFTCMAPWASAEMGGLGFCTLGPVVSLPLRATANAWKFCLGNWDLIRDGGACVWLDEGEPVIRVVLGSTRSPAPVLGLQGLPSGSVSGGAVTLPCFCRSGATES